MKLYIRLAGADALPLPRPWCRDWCCVTLKGSHLHVGVLWPMPAWVWHDARGWCGAQCTGPPERISQAYACMYAYVAVSTRTFACIHLNLHS